MLGVYDYTVILTYISLWISIGGMMLSLNGQSGSCSIVSCTVRSV